jgi:hypothetical protein
VKCTDRAKWTKEETVTPDEMRDALREIIDAWDYGYGMSLAVSYAISLIDEDEENATHETIETCIHLEQLKETMDRVLRVEPHYKDTDAFRRSTLCLDDNN